MKSACIARQENGASKSLGPEHIQPNQPEVVHARPPESHRVTPVPHHTSSRLLQVSHFVQDASDCR
jgi:hypothetical protein